MTPETIKGGEIVNKKRRENGVRELKLVEVGIIFDGEISEPHPYFSNKTSSSSIRRKITSTFTKEKLLEIYSNFSEICTKRYNLSSDKVHFWFSKIGHFIFKVWRRDEIISKKFDKIEDFFSGIIHTENNELNKGKNAALFEEFCLDAGLEIKGREK